MQFNLSDVILVLSEDVFSQRMGGGGKGYTASDMAG